jgi:hypothetical protein
MKTNVTDQTSEGEKKKPNEGILQGSLPADVGKVTANETIENKGKPKPTNKISHTILGDRVKRILKLPGEWWETLKQPEVSNRTVAVATVFIAIATGITWWEIHSGSEQTNKIVTAAQNIQSALDTQNDRNQAALEKTFIENRRALRRNLRQGQESMEASNTQSKAALDTSIAASKLDQRAWVGVLDIVPKEFTDTNGLVASVVFFNSGRTPARKVQVSAAFIISPVPMTGPSPEQIKTLKFRPAQSIAPQGRYNEVLGQIVSGEIYTETQMQGRKDALSRFQDIKNKIATLYYFGILKYDDIFGNLRETQFCVFLANPETKEMAFCDAFNDVN